MARVLAFVLGAETAAVFAWLVPRILAARAEFRTMRIDLPWMTIQLLEFGDAAHRWCLGHPRPVGLWLGVCVTGVCLVMISRWAARPHRVGRPTVLHSANWLLLIIAVAGLAGLAGAWWALEAPKMVISNLVE